jgi:hypothetical protein
LIVALIGSKSACEKLAGQISRDFDNIELLHYVNVQNFATNSITSKKQIDRFFILEDGIPIATEIVEDFYALLQKGYPGSKVIFFLKSNEVLELFNAVISSPNYLFVKSEKIKVRLLQDLILCNGEELTTRYPDSVFSSDVNILEDNVDLASLKKTEEDKKPVKENSAGFFTKVASFFKKEDKPVKGDTSLEDLSELEKDIKTSDGVQDKQQGLKRTKTKKKKKPKMTIIEDLSPDLQVVEDDGLDEDRDLVVEVDDSINEVENIFTEDVEGVEDVEDDFPLVVEKEPVNSVLTFDDSDSFDDFDKEYEFRDLKIESLKDKIDLKELDNLIEKAGVSIPDTSEDSVSFDNNDFEDLDIDKLEKAFKKKKQPKPKVIKTVEVREKVVEKVVHTTSANIRYNGINFIVVTGDRKTGVTSTAVSLAKEFGKKERTLLVDLDLVKKGLILHLNLEDLFSHEEHIYNNLLFANSENLKDVVYRDIENKIFTLQASLGVDIPEGRIKDYLVPTLLTQDSFTTVVIDCPINYLHKLEEVLLYSTILVCTESDQKGVLDTLICLDGLKFKHKFLMKNMFYVLSSRSVEVEFKDSLKTLLEFLEFKDSISYSAIDIIGYQEDIDHLTSVLL